jgi:serine/threonine protein kinase/tetratricopeptide (TPR) repeat protein
MVFVGAPLGGATSMNVEGDRIDSRAAELPAQVGPYAIESILGRGGMGIVYCGRKPGGPAVAIKTVRSPSPKTLSALRAEISVLRQARHRGVVQLLEDGLQNGLPWYAMELLSSFTLHSFNRGLWSTDEWRRQVTAETAARPPLEEQPGTAPSSAAERSQPLSPVAHGELPQVIDLYAQIFEAIGNLHRRGIVHRDLKPENIALREDGSPVLMDFGLASLAGGLLGRETLATNLADRALGTAFYASPEQIRGGGVDGRADLYSVGCMLYESLSGRPPFVGTSKTTILVAHREEPPRPLREVVAGAPSSLEGLLQSLLAKAPIDRPGTGEEAAALLRACSPVAARPRAPGAEETFASVIFRPSLVGRNEALAGLEWALSEAKNGRPQCVLASGPSGIGKTFFASAVAQRAIAMRFAVVTGESWAEVPGVRVRTGGPPLHLLRGFLQLVADHCRREGPGSTAELLGSGGRLLAEFEPLLGFVPGFERLPRRARFDPAAARELVVKALVNLVVQVARIQPLLLVLDDLQWADDLSLRFTRALIADQNRSAPYCVLGLYRSEETSPALLELGQGPARTVKLERLTDAELRLAIAEMLGVREVSPELCDSLVEHAGGNPFFAAEYLRTAIAERILIRRLGRWQISSAAVARLYGSSSQGPRTVQSLIHRRLAGLSAEEAQLLAAAAVLGKVPDLNILAAISGLARDGQATALEGLLARQIMERTAGGQIQFTHDQIREAAYGSQPSTTRQRLHHAAAEFIEMLSVWSENRSGALTSLGHHWAHAGQPRRAARAYLEAARAAEARFSHQDAARGCESALSCLAEAPDHGDPALEAAVREALGDIKHIIGQRSESEDEYRRAIEAVGASADVSLARLWRKVGKTRTARLDHRGALSAYQTADELLPEHPESDPAVCHEWIEIQNERVWTHYWLGDTEALRAVIASLRPIAERRGTAQQRANLHQAVCLVELRTARYCVSPASLETIKTAAESVENPELSPESASIHFILAFTKMLHGLTEEAHGEMRRVVVEADTLGDPLLRIRALTYLCVLDRQRGRVGDVLALVQEALSAPNLEKMHHYAGAAYANLGWATAAQGDQEQALTLLERALTTWRKGTPAYPFEHLAILPLARILLGQGRHDEAAQLLLELRSPEQRDFGRQFGELLAALAASAGAQRLQSIERLLAAASREGHS